MFVPELVVDFIPSTPVAGPGVKSCATKPIPQPYPNCFTMPMPMPMPGQSEFQIPVAWNTHSKRYFGKDSPADTSKTSDYHPITPSPSTQEESTTTQNLSGSSGDAMLPQDISSLQQHFDQISISNPEPLT